MVSDTFHAMVSDTLAHYGVNGVRHPAHFATTVRTIFNSQSRIIEVQQYQANLTFARIRCGNLSPFWCQTPKGLVSGSTLGLVPGVAQSDIRQSATDTRATTRRFALPEACCGVRHLLHSAFCYYGADTFQ